MSNENKLSPMGRTVFEKVNELLGKAFRRATETAIPQIEVPDGFVRVQKVQLGKKISSVASRNRSSSDVHGKQRTYQNSGFVSQKPEQIQNDAPENSFEKSAEHSAFDAHEDGGEKVSLDKKILSDTSGKSLSFGIISRRVTYQNSGFVSQKPEQTQNPFDTSEDPIDSDESEEQSGFKKDSETHEDSFFPSKWFSTQPSSNLCDTRTQSVHMGGSNPMKNFCGNSDDNLNADLIDFLEPLAKKMGSTGATILFLSNDDKILRGYRFDKNNFYNLLENFQPENLKPEDVNVKISTNQGAAEKFLEEFYREIEKLSEEISAFENAANARHDIAKDRKFGDWIQRFLIFVDKHSEDRAIQKLRDNLVEVLATMRIYVYDNVKLQEEGTPDVYRDDYFHEDYLIDNRTGKTYTRVSRPAVYSNETFLARGEIS